MAAPPPETGVTWATIGPLVGVVVGAILGGMAQVLNTWISARREERKARMIAAAELMDAFTEAGDTQRFHESAKLRHEHATERGVHVKRTFAEYKQANRAAQLALTQFQAKYSRLLMADPSPETTEMLAVLVSKLGEPHDEEASVALVELAHRAARRDRLIRRKRSDLA